MPLTPPPGRLGFAIGMDPVIEAYKKDVDRTLLRESLKLTVEERLLKFEQRMREFYAQRDAAEKQG